MSKAILIMDMPSCCDECDINGIFCGDVGSNDMCRAAGCPLKKVPKKRRTIGKVSENDQLCFNGGYNACIDEILEGSEANE